MSFKKINLEEQIQKIIFILLEQNAIHNNPLFQAT